MKRRTFFKGLLAGAAGAVSGFHLPLANAADYDGKLFVFVQADGGWDPTSFCDPKTNTPGERIINHWAEAGDTWQAGNLFYADFGNNGEFFEKYYDRMLVINGVDAQTNSHSAGVVHNWSGRVAEGYPSMTALLAAHHAPGLSLSYLSFGGFSHTAGLAPYTRLNGADLIRNIATPEVTRWDHSWSYINQADWETLRAFREANIARLAAAPHLLPRAARNRETVCGGTLARSDRRTESVCRSSSAGRRARARGGVRNPSWDAQRTAASSAARDPRFHGEGRRQCGSLAGRFRHARQSRSGAELAVGELDEFRRLSVGVCGNPWGGRPPGCRDGIGFRPYQPLQCGCGQGSLAYRQLRRDGKEPTLDQPCRRRNRRLALCAQDPPGHAAARRRQRNDHPPEAHSQGAPPILRNRGTHRVPSGSRSTTPKTSRFSDKFL